MIRSLLLSDVPDVARMLKETQQQHHQSNPQRYDRIQDQDRLCAIITSQLSNPDSLSLCMEQDEHVVGYLLAAFHEIPAGGILVPRKYVMLNEIAVREDHRRRGIADALMGELKDRARIGGATMLRAAHGVFNDTSARLLESHGLHAVTTTRELYFE